MYIKLIINCLLISLITSAYPVAVFHGIGDSCLINPGMGRITEFFSKSLGGVYAKCIETAGGPLDWMTSFKGQAQEACDIIKSDPNFAGDFSIVGLSQGALLGRIVLEACDMPGRVKRFVSIGGPHMGVGAFPHCGGGFICKLVNNVIGSAVYYSYIQNHVGPAGYFKDINHYNSFLGVSPLADINNENQHKNNSYKERFSNLEKVVLIKFASDTMIIPKETAWFQFYDQNKQVAKLEDSEFYKNDYIGLRKLNEESKIHFVELPGDHLRFNNDDIEKYMIPALK
jgi:palmitoyl-protein thioesterase